MGHSLPNSREFRPSGASSLLAMASRLPPVEVRKPSCSAFASPCSLRFIPLRMSLLLPSPCCAPWLARYRGEAGNQRFLDLYGKLVLCPIERWKQVIGGGLRSGIDERPVTEVNVPVHVLSRISSLDWLDTKGSHEFISRLTRWFSYTVPEEPARVTGTFLDYCLRQSMLGQGWVPITPSLATPTVWAREDRFLCQLTRPNGTFEST
jgi:hypothetical protein